MSQRKEEEVEIGGFRWLLALIIGLIVISWASILKFIIKWAIIITTICLIVTYYEQIFDMISQSF